jgi:hypothetical protein
MISSASHPKWPLRLPSWIWFPSIPISLWLIGSDYKKVLFDDQLCPSSKMAAILDFVSVD